MALRSAVAAAPQGFRRFLCTSSFPNFIPPTISSETSQRQMAEPSTNLFVSGLSKRTTTEKLQEAFVKFGEVIHARVVTDRVTGYSKGFGFVKYATLEDAAKGIEGMDGKSVALVMDDSQGILRASQFLDGWVIFAEYARPRPPVNQAESKPYTPYGNR